VRLVDRVESALTAKDWEEGYAAYLDIQVPEPSFYVKFELCVVCHCVGWQTRRISTGTSCLGLGRMRSWPFFYSYTGMQCCGSGMFIPYPDP
jgi:hypothetical protein